MKQFLAFAVVLLATLLMVNAIPQQLHRRKPPSFAQCKGNFPNPIKVKVSPVPLAFGKTETVTVSGVAKELIPDGTFLRLGISNADGDAIFDNFADFCAIPEVSCPVEPGTKYTASAKFNLPPNDVPGPSKVLVRIQIGDETLSCARGSVE
jgi:hypothetical protein